MILGKKITIAIDGPSASGKTTVARRLSKELGYSYLDTGLLYRAIAWKVLKEHIDPLDEAKVSQLCKNRIVNIVDTDGIFHIWMDRLDVTPLLKTPQLGHIASTVSKYKKVRENLLDVQREVGNKEGVILVGRDIGTQILPAAPVKFFMEASIQIRGKRRYEELVKKGYLLSLEQTIQEMIQRDKQDKEREIAPMQMAPDAVLIDTTYLSIEEVVETMLNKINSLMIKAGNKSLHSSINS